MTGEGEAVDPLIGQTVAQKYFIHQLLGRGGMGDVYKATHLTLDRPVVLKLLKKLFHSDPSLVQRFHREARAASRLNHPNSITIIDFGQTDDGTLFMAMEYLSGKSLERIVSEEHPLPESRVVHIVAQMLAALGEAHALGIIHRDLKPANVMIEPRRDEPDFVKVLDFGIAKLNEPGAGGPGLTQAGIVCGTPGYMSPEQVRGEELDPRSDIYAVGVIVYEMLTGVLPFQSDTPLGLVTKHLVEDAPPVAVRRPGTVVSPDLEAVVMKALARDREQRFSSADEMRAALLACSASARAPLRHTPPPSSTLIMDSAGVPGAAAPRPQTGPARPVTSPPPPSRPTPMRSFTEALPVTPGEGFPGAPPAPPPPAGVSPAPRTAPPVQKPPAPAPRTAPPAAAPAHDTPASARRSKAPLVAAGGAIVAVLAGFVVWNVTRSPAAPVPAAGAPAAAAPPVQVRTEPAAPAPQPEPVPAPADPSPQPTAEAAPASAPEPGPPAVAERAAPAPAPAPLRRRAGTPPAPKVHPKPAASTPSGAGRGVRLVKSELNAIPTPPANSGDGVLAVDATPWAVVAIDGNEIGETPREVRLGAGTYKVKATHPLGTREKVVTIRPGKREVWSPTFAN